MTTKLSDRLLPAASRSYVCPSCGSDSVQQTGVFRQFAASTPIVGLKCQCGRSFTVTEGSPSHLDRPAVTSGDGEAWLLSLRLLQSGQS